MATARIPAPLLTRDCTLELRIDEAGDSIHQVDILNYFGENGFDRTNFRSCQKVFQDGFLLTFANTALCARAVAFCEGTDLLLRRNKLSGWKAPNIARPVRREDPNIRTLHIYGAPHELDDLSIRARLEEHLVIVSMFRGKLKDPAYRHVESGMRHVKFTSVKKPIPTYVYIKGSKLSLRYDGQDTRLRCTNCLKNGHAEAECADVKYICRWCGQGGHFVFKCPKRLAQQQTPRTWADVAAPEPVEPAGEAGSQYESAEEGGEVDPDTDSVAEETPCISEALTLTEPAAESPPQPGSGSDPDLDHFEIAAGSMQTAETASDSDALGGLDPPLHSEANEPRHDASTPEPNPAKKQRVQSPDQWLGIMDTSIPKLVMDLSASLIVENEEMISYSGELAHSSTSDRDRTEDVADGIDTPEPVSVPMHQERARSLGDIISSEPS